MPAQQYLAAGLVDEMEINLMPSLLGNVMRGAESAASLKAKASAS
jgi:riboflavin biosynthesis pyrimidine reductase